MSSYTVIENFLNKEDLLNLNEVLFKNNFPWYLSGILREIEDLQFSHFFFNDGKISSSFFPIINPILIKLKIKHLIRVRANVLLKNDSIKEHGFHIDTEEKNVKTAVFYCDTNNGFTKLINGDIIKSVENKILIFNAEIMHTGTTCTDKPRRTVINFNYIEDENN